MGRPVMFISAGITAFVLALTFGAVFAYRYAASTAAAEQPPANQTGTTIQLAAASAPTEMPDVAPQDAASIAAQYLNRTDLYSAELVDRQGALTYKITFSSGDVVYISQKGQVLASEPPPAPIVVTTVSGGAGAHYGGGSSKSGGESEHEGDGE